MDIKYRIGKENDSVVLYFTPILASQEQKYIIKQDWPDEWAVKFFTATTDMRDFIGNVTEIVGNKCSVRGIYRGSNRVINNIIIIDNQIKKVGDRVIVSEHVNIKGNLEFIATKKRILQKDINFINIGWSNTIESRYLRIDVYTGQSIYYKGTPCFAFLNG